MSIVEVPQPSFQPIKTLDMIKSAMFESNILAPGDELSAEDGAWGLQKIQRLIDKMNAVRQAIYSVNFTEFTLLANHAPHTIGPGGDFNVTPRPVKIVSASFILNAGQGQNEVDSPQLNIRDHQWWAALPTKSLQSSICTDLYYEPAIPLGNLNFWPICNTSNPVRLEMWSSLVVPLKMTDQLTFPQGYWDAIVLTLAVELCSSFEKEPSPTLASRQEIAWRIIMANNAHPPRIRTDESMPRIPHSSGRPDFNFLTGLRE
jgi:hypothetical protein